MLIKSVKNPRDIVIMADDEFEQAQTQSDYLSLPTLFIIWMCFQRHIRIGAGEQATEQSLKWQL